MSKKELYISPLMESVSVDALIAVSIDSGAGKKDPVVVPPEPGEDPDPGLPPEE